MNHLEFNMLYQQNASNADFFLAHTPESIQCTSSGSSQHGSIDGQQYDSSYCIQNVWKRVFNATSHDQQPSHTKDHKQKKSNQKRSRTVFTDAQLIKLEREFSMGHYLSHSRRSQIATTLNLPERQIKIWFQNRRLKYKKNNTSTKCPNERLHLPLSNQEKRRFMEIIEKSSINYPSIEEESITLPSIYPEALHQNYNPAINYGNIHTANYNSNVYIQQYQMRHLNAPPLPPSISHQRNSAVCSCKIMNGQQHDVNCNLEYIFNNL